MEVKSEIFYVDSISLTYYDKGKKYINNYGEKEITTNLFEFIKEYINNFNIEKVELSNTKEDISMIVFYENGLSHIGIVDMYNDMIYYYKNKSKDKTLVEIAGQVFEGDKICKDNHTLIKIMNFFAIHGKKYSNVEWIEDNQCS